MRILILGIGDAFTRTNFGSSALVHGPGGYVLIDCPDLIHRVLHESGTAAGWAIDAASIHDIIITHLHGDHCNGLESFGFYRRYAALTNPGLPRSRLHVSAPVAQRLWERLAPAMDAANHGRPSTLSDFFDVHIIAPDRPATIAGLTVDCRFTKHPVPTIGLLLSDGRSTFGWSGDTPFEPEHIQWLNRADLFVHESNAGPAHATIDDLNRLPAAIRQKMRLIHLPDDFDPRRTDIALLTQGQVIEL